MPTLDWLEYDANQTWLQRPSAAKRHDYLPGAKTGVQAVDNPTHSRREESDRRSQQYRRIIPRLGVLSVEPGDPTDDFEQVDPLWVPVWSLYVLGECTLFHDYCALRRARRLGYHARCRIGATGRIRDVRLRRSPAHCTEWSIGSRIVVAGGGIGVWPWMQAIVTATGRTGAGVRGGRGAALGVEFLGPYGSRSGIVDHRYRLFGLNQTHR